MTQAADVVKQGIWIAAMLLLVVGAASALQTSVPDSSTPRTPEFAKATVRWVLVSLPDRKLALFENGKVVRTYRVAIGKTSTPSPAGKYKIVNHVTNPAYYHKGQVIPPGQNNPVGSRWMGLSAKSYGIHGTNQPKSIGQAASTGCIRMSKQDLEELFELVNVGDAVEIRAQRDEQIAAVFGTVPEAIAQAPTDIAAGGQ